MPAQHFQALNVYKNILIERLLKVREVTYTDTEHVVISIL